MANKEPRVLPTTPGPPFATTEQDPPVAVTKPAARPVPVRGPASHTDRVTGSGTSTRGTRRAAKQIQSTEEVVASPDATPAQVPTGTFYKVRVNNLFILHNEVFRPDQDYTVTEDIYNGNVTVGEESKPFKDFVVSADERVRK